MNPIIWIGAAAVALAGGGSVMENEVKPPQIAPARDGDVAIREELCAARKKATVEAFDLFIARHPDHPLVPVARQEREKLQQRQSGHAH